MLTPTNPAEYSKSDPTGWSIESSAIHSCQTRSGGVKNRLKPLIFQEADTEKDVICADGTKKTLINPSESITSKPDEICFQTY